MTILQRMMMGVSFHAFALMAPDDGGGAGGGDAPAASGGDAGASAAPAPAGTTAMGGTAPAAAPADGAPAADPAAGAAKPGEGDAKPADGEETAEEKAAREAREAETPEQKATREAAEAEEAAKHAPKDGKYEAFTLPDGFDMDEPTQARFSEFAVANDMNQEKAQQAIDLHLAVMAEQGKAWADKVAGWQKTAEADPEIGGKDRPEKLATMRAGRDMFGQDPELLEAFETAGIGDNPAIQRFFYRVGKELAGGRKTKHGDGPAGSNATLGQRLYG